MSLRVSKVTKNGKPHVFAGVLCFFLCEEKKEKGHAKNCLPGKVHVGRSKFWQLMIDEWWGICL